MILGEHITYRGELTVGSGIKISYVSQDTSHLRGSLTEYIRASGMEERLFKAVLRKLDFSRTQFEKDMDSYSEGQKKKVLIARSLCERAHLYIWDEPLNFIDVYSRMQIEELLLMWKPTLLLWSMMRYLQRKLQHLCVESESNLTRAKNVLTGEFVLC